MSVAPANRAMNAFAREAVLSASPARLLVMLFDRLMLDLARAEEAQTGQEWVAAHGHLVHAQEILGELSGSLDLAAWDGAAGLLGIYNYAGTALMNANIHRDPAPTRECIALLEPLRQAWHEAAAAPAPVAGNALAGNAPAGTALAGTVLGATA